MVTTGRSFAQMSRPPSDGSHFGWTENQHNGFD
jgi:hypothetical protein